MIKFLTIGVLLFFLYRFVVTPKTLKEPPKQSNLETDDGEFVEYEEVE